MQIIDQSFCKGFAPKVSAPLVTTSASQSLTRSVFCTEIRPKGVRVRTKPRHHGRGKISGGHFNPAVTLAVVLSGRFLVARTERTPEKSAWTLQRGFDMIPPSKVSQVSFCSSHKPCHSIVVPSVLETNFYGGLLLPVNRPNQCNLVGIVDVFHVKSMIVKSSLVLLKDEFYD